MDKIKKRNLLLTLLAFMLAAVSAVLIFTVAPKRVNAEEKTVPTVVEKTEEEKRQEREEKLRDFLEKVDKEELIKNAGKNRSTEITDYSSYVEITTGYFALNDFLIIFDDNDCYSSGFRRCQYLGTDYEFVDFWMDDVGFWVMVESDYIGGSNFIFMERGSLSIFYDDEVPTNAVGGYYKSDTITCTMSGEDIELNTAEVLIPVDGLSEYGIRIFVPAQDEPTEPTEPEQPDNPTPDEPGQGTNEPGQNTGTNENNNTPSTNNKKISLGLSGIVIVIAIIGGVILIKKRK